MVIQGAAADAFYGDCVVIGKRVDDVGSAAEWTPSPAVPNWQNVDEVDPDEDTTRNASAVIGARDRHLITKITEVPDTSEVLAAQVGYRVKKSDAGSRSLRSSLTDGGSDVFGTERFPPETSYLTFLDDPQPSDVRWYEENCWQGKPRPWEFSGPSVQGSRSLERPRYIPEPLEVIRQGHLVHLCRGPRRRLENPIEHADRLADRMVLLR